MNKPFKLRPAYKDYLWGGNRLNEELNKGINISPLAETWECSTHPDGSSTVVGGEFDGQLLSEVIKSNPDFLGTHPHSKDELPILIKFIDAGKDLSVQVHPTDEYAQVNENGQLGKTEMWYVMDASKDAKLIYGLKEDADRETIKEALEKGKLSNYLQSIPVKKNDIFYVEAGTIHAIGAGSLIVEIQENSNLTYRLWDYDRLDKDGKKRVLHIEKALDVANLSKAKAPRQPMRVLRYQNGVARELLSRCKYFEVYRMLVNTDLGQKVNFKADSLSFRVLLNLDGHGTLSFTGEGSFNSDETETIDISKGDCIFVPADSCELTINGNLQLLDVRC